MAPVQNLLSRGISWVLQRRIVRAALHFSGHNGGLLAAAITFRAVFSIFAAVLLGFSAAAIWLNARPEVLSALVDALSAAIPGIVGEGGIVQDTSDLTQGVRGYGIAGVVSALGLLWASLGAVRNFRTAIQELAGTTAARSPVWWELLGDLLFALAVGGLLVASAVVTFLGSAFVTNLLGWIGVEGGGGAEALTRVVAILSTFVLDMLSIALLFRMLSGVKPSARSLWTGALIGGIGLTVLQQASSLFVGGAGSNPLLTTVASFIALLLWFNLSAQVILIACSFVVIAEAERVDRVGERYGAQTFAQRKVREAERDVEAAVANLNVARDAEQQERAKLAERRAAAGNDSP